MSRHCEVAGAGFAGLAMAIALRGRGWSVRVHEAAPELRAFGAGIFLWDNGLQVLEQLGVPEAALGEIVEVGQHQSRNERGELLGERNFRAEKGTRMVTMTRQQLYAALLDRARRAGAEIVAGSRAVAGLSVGQLVLASGERRPADLVVGADGVRSAVRDSLGLLQDRQRFGYGIARMLVPRRPEELHHELWRNTQNFWGPTRRVLYAPCNSRDLYLALGAHVSDLEAAAIPIRKEVWLDSFPLLRPILERIGEAARYDEYETIRTTRWSVGRVAILGDAAHGMPPTLGQGAGTAMMNALSLAAAADAAIAAAPEAIPAALEAWEARERPLVEHTQNISSEFARTRAGSDGKDVWTSEVLRAAHHRPGEARA